MTASVRAYTHSGVQAMPVASYGGQLATNGQFSLRQPYLHKQVLSASTGSSVETTAATLAPSTDQNVKLVFVQVQPGKRVHYEITPYGQDLRSATSDSPILLNDTILVFGPGWTLSVLEAGDTA